MKTNQYNEELKFLETLKEISTK